MASYLLLETGDRIILEDSSGYILLELEDGYPGYPFQGPKVTYTGPPPMVTASKNSPYLIGNPYRKTHNNGPHWPS